MLFGEKHSSEVARPTASKKVHVLTRYLRLADTDTKLSFSKGREQQLETVRSEVGDSYDNIFIDCVLSTSLSTIKALVATDAFILPVSSYCLSIEDVVGLGEVLKNVFTGLGEAVPARGVILTIVQHGDDETRMIIEEVSNHYGGKVFNTEIRHNPAIEEAPTQGQSIFDDAPDSHGAAEYRSLLEEVGDRLDRYGSVYGKAQEEQSSRA